MPAKDREEILKILKKRAKEQKARFISNSSRKKGAVTSNSSKLDSTTSLSSVNKDLEHWVSLQSGMEAKDKDVCDIGEVLGLKFKEENKKKFNMLSKEGRRELREEVGRILAKGVSGGSGGRS